MQIVYHIGAHCTDDGQIHHTLARNRRFLIEDKVIVPNLGHWRPILRETIAAMKGEKTTPEIQEIMLDSFLNEDDPQRIIFSNNSAICGFQRVIARGELYPDAGNKCRKMFNLFHDQHVEFHLAMRNPATFLPEVFSKLGAESFEAYLAQFNPMEIRWSTVVNKIREAVPNAQLKVWCNEDIPFIWNELIREITDHGPNTTIVGHDEFLATVMMEEGLDRMAAYLKDHPPANEIQRRRILSAFLDKFVIDDPEPDFSAPIWTDAYTDTLTDIYEEDLFTVERIPGVHFISP